MKLVSAYAIGTLLICVVSLITDGIGISRGGVVPEKMDIVTVLSIIQIFWFFVSVIALICFIGFKIPIRAPLVFSVYYVLSLLVMIPLVVSGIAKKDPQIVLCIFIFDVFVTALIAFLNFDLLMYVRKDAARLKNEQDSWTS
jgi:hypothetical protein